MQGHSEKEKILWLVRDEVSLKVTGENGSHKTKTEENKLKYLYWIYLLHLSVLCWVT